MVSIRRSAPEDGDTVVQIWRQSVDATHSFLSPEDRAAIDGEVRHFLPRLPLWLAVDKSGEILGFMGLTESHIDALFIAPAHFGRGLGRQLVAHAASMHPVLTTDVNEQNGQAVAFYQRLGFRQVGRSPVDGDGRPYPLLHLRRDAAG